MKTKYKPVEILVIGTEPPCPRCDLLGLWVDEIVAGERLTQKITVKHLAFDSLEGIDFARRKGKKIGTAKHVAFKEKILLDKSALDAWFKKRKIEIPNWSRPADLWNEEMDEILFDCQQAAESVSYFMTPVFVLNEEVKHHGSVPERTDVLKWIMESIQ